MLQKTITYETLKMSKMVRLDVNSYVSVFRILDDRKASPSSEHESGGRFIMSTSNVRNLGYF